jgi:uncharacterized membrane protein
VVESTTVRRVAVQALLTTAVFAALDFVWLGIFMNGFYKAELGSMARLSGPDWWAAFAVDGVLVRGRVVLVLPRAEGQATRALGFGALMGVVSYGTYDLTAYSVLAGFSLRMTLVDIVWGAAICGLTSAIVTLLEPRLAGAPAPRSSTRSRSSSATVAVRRLHVPPFPAEYREGRAPLGLDGVWRPRDDVAAQGRDHRNAGRGLCLARRDCGVGR